ncbi:DUF3224 domain-containing protein [Alteromonas sp. A081]|uniref:DUF3224 domain-containing protein n=1 Tax=Alteromonas sp. A081 TaxID=3410269 RepID=UPI003B98074E
MNGEGVFTITQWNEEVIKEKCNQVKTVHASVVQAYEGDMKGEGHVEFIMSYKTGDSACFVGFEEFIGVIDGRRGTVTFKHDGSFEDGVARSAFNVVAETATGELSGVNLTGHFTSAESGKANYSFTE